MDIQQLKISDGGAGSIGWGGETFAIWGGGPDVVEGSGFFYYDKSMAPEGKEQADFYWGDGDCNPVNLSIAAGQAVVVQCAEGLDVQFAGQVLNENVPLTTVDQFNFVGNPFPTPIDIQNIKISDGEAGSIGWGGETFAIWEGGPDVVEGSGFFYYDKSMAPEGKEQTGFYWGDGDCNPVTYPIAIGQGAVIQCAENLDVTITKPYSL